MTVQKPKQASKVTETKVTRYKKEAVIRALETIDQSIAHIVLDDSKDYSIQEANDAVLKWKKGELK